MFYIWSSAKLNLVHTCECACMHTHVHPPPPHTHLPCKMCYVISFLDRYFSDHIQLPQTGHSWGTGKGCKFSISFKYSLGMCAPEEWGCLFWFLLVIAISILMESCPLLLEQSHNMFPYSQYVMVVAFGNGKVDFMSALITEGRGWEQQVAQLQIRSREATVRSVSRLEEEDSSL